jgi:hypothetical protein
MHFSHLYFVILAKYDGKVLLNFDSPVLPGKAAKKDVAPAEEI